MDKVLATDLDGTLFYPKKKIGMVSRKNIAFLHRLKEEGDRIVLVSSRSETFLRKVQNRIGMDVDFIGADGSLVVIDGQKVRDEYFVPGELKTLVEELRTDYDPPLFLASSQDMPLIMTKTRVSKFTNLGYFLYQFFQGVYRESWVRSDYVFFREIASGRVNKLMVMIGLSKKKRRRAFEITEDLRKRYPQFDFVWLDQFIEITPRGCSKASGLAFYLDYLGLNRDNVVVVGDSGNDVPMLDAFPTQSYAMAHAPKEVREHAKGVVKRVYELERVLYPSADNHE